MYLLTAALVIAGWVVLLITLRRSLERTRAELRAELQGQIDKLSASISALQQAAKSRSEEAGQEFSAGSAAAPGSGSAHSPVTQTGDEITPETLAMITEKITILLGRKVHVRSVKLLAKFDVGISPWAQHGRAVIQASHNLSSLRREN
ncbi:MAG: hypothetical protein ABSG02_00825 [Terriglobales bacterium]|jgi:hypothetical protein